MKALFLALVLSLSLTGCFDYYMPYGDPPVVSYTGTREFCDDFGCRYVTGQYYFDHGEVVYWDEHFQCWVGPRGYLVGAVWHQGFLPGYHEWYHRGLYHRQQNVFRNEWHEHHEFREERGFHGGGHHR